MRKIIIKFIALTLIPLFTGCATVVKRTDLSAGEIKSIYPATVGDVSGTINYCQNKLDPFGAFRGATTKSNPNVLEKFLWCTFATIDLPISLVADTICLPVDLYLVNNKKRLQQKDALNSDSAAAKPE